MGAVTMHSATLAINETLEARRAAGRTVLHLGFGEAGLPVPDSVAAVLAGAVGRNSYGPVAGSVEAREAAAGWFSRRGSNTEPGQVLFAPGSKPLLFALLLALPGDVVLPCPSWVSYAAQASLAAKRTIDVPIPAEAGGVPDPRRLEQALEAARAAGARPGILVLTVPDNPTGTVARADHLREVCAIAGKWGLAVIADEIYADLVHDGRAPSAAHFLPQRTVVTTGLSKSMALGGWRIGMARVPQGAWGQSLMADLVGVASEIWSSLAAPMQAVAAHVLQDPPELVTHIARSRRLHAAVAQAVHAEFIAAGAVCRRPGAGFYLYPDFEPLRPVLAGQGIDGGVSLADALLERHGVGVLAGEAFGDTPDGLRVRVATSLLYGESVAERWKALDSDDPVSLPWIASSLEHLRGALRDLTRHG
ncbi:pyridoxal phosphate-dependent aminotransferase [Streptomyces sp. NPDC044780]|uniref:pyridoxal phosphate-dependent aminotransferase n=1 Tax=unclassified Streptomyces TaxID=2593676 RepID=UPI00340CB39A